MEKVKSLDDRIVYSEENKNENLELINKLASKTSLYQPKLYQEKAKPPQFSQDRYVNS